MVTISFFFRYLLEVRSVINDLSASVLSLFKFNLLNDTFIRGGLTNEDQ